MILLLSLSLVGCEENPWNDPYPNEKKTSHTLYSAFTVHPQHLDPAQSYSEAEWVFIGQIYEAPLQYNYLKRPYTLEPLTAVDLPEVQYFSQKGEKLADNALPENIAYSEYVIHLKPGIYYQKHPAFAKDEQGDFLYHDLNPSQIQQYQTLTDFKQWETRELIAEDYVYQIKRMADPSLSSPIFGLMSRYIVGLQSLRDQLNTEVTKQLQPRAIDLRNYSLLGVEAIDRYRYRIRVSGKYPQLRFWLATLFFVPMPWEAVQFYAQPGLAEHNISLDWYPVGTGPYVLSENNPERRMVLEKNPLYRREYYPTTKNTVGETLPMVDKILFSLERESIPYWAKFLQGYYDSAGVSSDNFNSAIQLNAAGNEELSPALKKLEVTLQTSVSPGVWYWGFNFLDSVVGGSSEKAKKLRQAIALCFDIEEFIAIFLNGRGIVASGPIPSDIIGFEVQTPAENSNLEKAKKLLKEAGYESGLTLYFDTEANGSPDEIATQAWLKKQLEKIGITLVIRGTTFNRFVEKLRTGTAQLFFFGWSADYPDPENFLFLFYGPNKNVLEGGPNVSNYQNKAYDMLYEKMREMDNGPARLKLIQEMDAILKADKVWIGGFYPLAYSLQHQWLEPRKPSGLINNTLKYVKLYPELRAKKQQLWNEPYRWPLLVLLGLAFVGIWGGKHWYKKRQQQLLERAR
jgi:oligopeptide transport system substrate-binding protein